MSGITARKKPSVFSSSVASSVSPFVNPLPNPLLKIPHMGWNAVRVTQPHPLLAHLRPGDEFYFVHSFYPQPADPGHTYAVSDYGGEFPAAIGKDNLFAVQFHAEKSGAVGLKVLENFARWRPS
jgi:glutamine amidotransferase